MKKYNVILRVGSIEVGTYTVEAENEENAIELAWELAEMQFSAEIE